MTVYDQEGTATAATSERLLFALAEQLKMPLVQIARLSELASITSEQEKCLHDIEVIAEMATRFIDSYLLSSRLQHETAALELEPVCISSVLQDAAHRLYRLAKQYDCELQVHVHKAAAPVMAHRAALETALTSLGHTVIESQTSQSLGTKSILALAAHRNRSGTVAGIFGDVGGLSDKGLYRASKTYGQVQQPLNEMAPGSAAGIFIADSILSVMSTKLRVAHHHRLPGLAATFLPSSQLSLV